MRKKNSVDWKKINGIGPSVAFFVATAGGAGLSPRAPGTMGTLVALPIAYCIRDWGWESRLLFWGVLTGIGVWAAGVFDQLMHSNDNQSIVIDEVIGLGITSWTAGGDWVNWIVAFVLFRFFDILKPPPVRQLDGWSKKQSGYWGGFGVIADDMVAGLMALIVILGLQWGGILK